LITLSGVGAGGTDMTNELTYVILEVIDEMTPILEPKPNVACTAGERRTSRQSRRHGRGQPGRAVPAQLRRAFDGRHVREAKRANIGHLINEDNVHEYAPVGCLENTMVGNDRSGTVDNNLNLLKAVELALTGGKDLLSFVDRSPARNRHPAGRSGHRRCDAV
jgi:formate C-acetyltransferase